MSFTKPPPSPTSNHVKVDSAPESTHKTSKKTPRNFTGFTKTSNLVLFSLTAGVFSIFCTFNFLTGLEDGHWMKPKTAGEQFWYQDRLMHLGMQVHLCSVLPAGILLPLQFLPIMRRKFMSFHKLAGQLLFIMLIVGDITALSIARHSFGGTIDTQVVTVFLSILTAFSTYKAWRSIRNLHIDQHRAWVIRTWSYAGAILTLRIFMIIIALTANKVSPEGYRSVLSCEELLFTYKYVANETSVESLYNRYPACLDYNKSTMGNVFIIVNARLRRYYPEERQALLNLVFGVAGWAALVLHLSLTEMYLNYTKDEDERLRRVSVARRKAAGLGTLVESSK